MALCLQPDCREVSGVGRTDPAAGSNLLLGTAVVGVEGAGGEKFPLLCWFGGSTKGNFFSAAAEGGDAPHLGVLSVSGRRSSPCPVIPLPAPSRDSPHPCNTEN